MSTATELGLADSEPSGGQEFDEQTGPMLARLRELTDRWLATGRPTATQWSTQLAPHRELTNPLLTPRHWRPAAPASTGANGVQDSG